MIAFVVLGFRKKLNSQGSEFWVASNVEDVLVQFFFFWGGGGS